VSRGEEIEELKFYLMQLEFLRDRLGEKKSTLFTWFISRCTVPSGRKKRYYMYGTPESMWVEYMNYCVDLGQDWIEETKFHLMRKKERVGILKGDIFMNPMKHDLAKATAKFEELQKKYPRPNQKQKGEIALAEKAIKEIEVKLAWNAQKKKEYKDAHLNLENDSNRAVITLDFFGTGKTTTSLGDEDGDFIDLILVIATKEELSVPKSLLDELIEEVTPLSIFKTQIAEQMLNPEESDSAGSRGPYLKKEKEITSHTQAIKAKRRERELPPLDVSDRNSYVPHLAYFHCISKKKVEKVSIKQTHDFLMYFLDFLFLKHDLLKGISNVDHWSDGCGKHFKTYPTHWNFLPPHDEL